jgi:hypothetical protein
MSILFRAQLWLTAGVGVIAFLLAGVLQYRLAITWLADLRADFQSYTEDK